MGQYDVLWEFALEEESDLEGCRVYQPHCVHVKAGESGKAEARKVKHWANDNALVEAMTLRENKNRPRKPSSA